MHPQILSTQAPSPLSRLWCRIPTAFNRGKTGVLSMTKEWGYGSYMHDVRMRHTLCYMAIRRSRQVLLCWCDVTVTLRCHEKRQRYVTFEVYSLHQTTTAAVLQRFWYTVTSSAFRRQSGPINDQGYRRTFCGMRIYLGRAMISVAGLWRFTANIYGNCREKKEIFCKAWKWDQGKHDGLSWNTAFMSTDQERIYHRLLRNNRWIPATQTMQVKRGISFDLMNVQETTHFTLI